MDENPIEPLTPPFDLMCDLITSGRGWGDDMILRSILSFHDAKVQLRSVSPTWRNLVEARFPLYVKYDPPLGGQGVVEVEEDLQMNKLHWCATLQFGKKMAGAVSDSSLQGDSQQRGEKSFGKDDHSGYLQIANAPSSPGQPGQQESAIEFSSLSKECSNSAIASKVTFTNWVPSYYRSNANDDRTMSHDMSEEDTIATWILVTKLLQGDKCGKDASRLSPGADDHSQLPQRGEACFACNGNGVGCRLCSGSGVREVTSPSTGPSFDESYARSSFLWVRCGVDRDLSCGRNNREIMSELAIKRPLSSQELKALKDLLDHRQNPHLQLRRRAPAPFVQFGGVSNV